MSQAEASAQDIGEGPRGIGGWLVLPLLGLVLTPVVVVLQLSEFGPVVEAWPLMSMGQSILVVVELICNFVLYFVLPPFLLVLAFRRRWEFPGLYIIWAAAVPFFLIADSLVGYWAFREVFEASGEGMFDDKTWQGIVRSLWSAAIWIPYMMRSRRVQNTFVN
ncbi:DUF2569 domain-containing protein [Mesorhizobium sp. IMUNJ 23232]|uniref:DUF2569 domain-containing protein n=1 Tax=Mesorhizobium sp. IMUNJ 23232 TaxID=3376064 RepID=UPI0037B7A4F3